jgi:hypothetical protein
MIRHPLRLLVLGVCLACLPARAATDAEQAMVGAWEISNAARDKTCPLTFTVDAGEGGFKLELDPGCRTAFPSLKDVAAWAIGHTEEILFEKHTLDLGANADVRRRGTRVRHDAQAATGDRLAGILRDAARLRLPVRRIERTAAAVKAVRERQYRHYCLRREGIDREPHLLYLPQLSSGGGLVFEGVQSRTGR